MRDEQILPDAHANLTVPHPLVARCRVAAPVSDGPAGCAGGSGWCCSPWAAVIAIEIRNHAHMWREHQSGQTIWTDHELLWEIILFGLVLPILAGVILEYMGRTAIERDRDGQGPGAAPGVGRPDA